MNNMVGDFLAGPNPVAGTTIGGVYNPNAMQFMMSGQTGKLFSANQFGTIIGAYMPSAMYNAFASPAGGATIWNNLMGVFGQTGGNPAAFNAALRQMSSQMALTRQQSGVLNTLEKYVMPNVMSRNASAGVMMQDPRTGQFFQMPGATLGAQWQNAMAMMGMMGVDTALVQQVAYQMAMQGFMGNTAKYPTSYLDQIAASRPTNDSLYTNRFGLDLKVKATQDVTVNVRLLAYKVFGSQDSNSITGNGGTPYFADRVGVFDGTLGHIPSSSFLNVDRAYATWSNILELPMWFSIGRRPATDGAPLNFKNNTNPPGNGGTPALLVNYAFDGMTLGIAPDFEMLPGFYAKVCYGRGFESGYDTSNAVRNGLKDTDMLGVAIIPVDTEPLRIWTQWNRGFDIFDFPVMNNTAFGNTAPSKSLGAIDWFGIGAASTIKKVGPGDLNFFVDTAMSITHPSNNVSENAGYQGMLTGEFFAQDFNPKAKTGYAVYTGLRYDLPTRTKIGFEYNYGSKYWITFSPAADDMWTSKVGTRGHVFEPYVIQELDLKPISSIFAKAFFKVGYQYYNFEYTGSNNWVGAPIKMSDIQPTDMMLMAPLKRAQKDLTYYSVLIRVGL